MDTGRPGFRIQKNLHGGIRIETFGERSSVLPKQPTPKHKPFELHLNTKFQSAASAGNVPPGFKPGKIAGEQCFLPAIHSSISL
jgi:hypothetical protein